MIFDATRHEALHEHTWDAEAARAMLQRIAAGAESDFVPGSGWATHPEDSKSAAPSDGLYFGACGVIWALRFLHARGAIALQQDYAEHLSALKGEPGEEGSYLFGDTAMLMLQHAHARDAATADRIAERIASTMRHPARELMWGSPGTMLAALFMHGRTAEPRFADLFRRTAEVLESQLLWSEDLQCHYWDQELYGERSTYLDAVHGFVATAAVLALGRDLLEAPAWAGWQRRIAHTIRATAEWDGGLVNWRAWLTSATGGRKLVQFCHGAPGFVICLADNPDPSLDDLLRAAGETTWRAGPLRKGSNLCHGTGGNGYAFLKLYQRFGDELWLERARAFAMHGIEQVQQSLRETGQWRHSLWTGDLGFAIYLLDCIEGKDRFPTLDVFDA